MVITLRTKKGDSIIEKELNKFDTNAQKSEYIRKALESFIEKNNNTKELEKIDKDLQAIFAKLQNIIVVKKEDEIQVSENDEPLDTEKNEKLTEEISGLFDF